MACEYENYRHPNNTLKFVYLYIENVQYKGSDI